MVQRLGRLGGKAGLRLMPAPKTFLGYDGGSMVFDLGDGAGPIALPASGSLAVEAARLEAAAGRDPGAVFARGGGAGIPVAGGTVDPALAAALPPAPGGAMGPGALAAAPTKAPSVVLDIGPPAPAGPPVKVGLGAPLELTPMAPAAGSAGLPELTPQQLAKGFSGAQRAEPVPFAPQAGGQDLRAVQAQVEAANRPAAGPPVLVPTPAQAAGARGAGEPAPPGGQNSLEYQNWLRSEIAAEARRRPGAPVVVPGGKFQTGEHTQGEVGPSAETLAALDANGQRTLATQREQNEANADRDRRVGDLTESQLGVEQEAAQRQAEIAQRRQVELNGIAAQQDQLRQQIAAAEVDPQRWWKRKGTGEALAIGIGAALTDLARGLTGRLDQPNRVLEGVREAIDKDVELQIRDIDKKRGDLNELQRTYVQAKERYGDEGLASDLAKQAAQIGLKAEIQRAVAKAENIQGREAAHSPQSLAEMAEMEQAFREAMGADSPLAQQAAQVRLQKLANETRSYSVKGRLLELQAERAELERKASIEARMNGAIARQYVVTQDKKVGGGGGADPKKIRGLYKELSDVEGDQRKLAVSEREAVAKGKPAPEKGVFLDGQYIAAHPGASGTSVDKAQDRITYSDDALETVKAIRERAKSPGGMVPGDPSGKINAMALAGALANASGSGVPSESDKADAETAVKAGPRQEEALRRIEQKALGYKISAVKRVGGKP